jgi:hypothetical protein
LEPRGIQPDSFVVRRKADDAGPNATRGAAHAEGNRPGGRAHKLDRAVGVHIADKQLNAATRLWRVICDGWSA